MQYHVERIGDGSDYYPLTTQEVIELLETARALKVHQSFNPDEANADLGSIQMRLEQGIPGSWYPARNGDPATEKLTELDRVFVTWTQDPDTLFFKETPLTESSDIVVNLIALMQ